MSINVNYSKDFEGEVKCEEVHPKLNDPPKMVYCSTLKEMKIIWNKFQDQNLSLDAVTEEEVLALKTAILEADVKKLTNEEKGVRELLERADLGMHKAVVARLYEIFVYV